MLTGVEVLCHSSIRLNKGKVIYFDPYKIERGFGDADFIFITHSHYDHFSEIDINKVKKDTTKIVLTADAVERAERLGFKSQNIIKVLPNSEFYFGDLKVKTVPAYNINKNYHPKENNWVGYIIEIYGVKYYIAGDTDNLEELKKVECDVAFLPVGGTYTMTAEEAANLANNIRPKVAVPIHYGTIVGTKKDAENFIYLLGEGIEGKILMK